MRSITAIVPVRGGSRRLKNKNILPFGDSNLLIHKIRQLKQVNSVDLIVVSSDSEQMLEMAKEEGVMTHKRPIEYADDVTRPFGEVVAYICADVPGDDILWAPCVAPLCRSEDYEQAIADYYKALQNGYDSLVSMERFQKYLWDEAGPVNYSAGSNHVKSQLLPPMYFVTNGIYIAPREKMIQWNYFLGPKPYRFILSKRASIDIDDELDLLCARAWYENKN